MVSDCDRKLRSLDRSLQKGGKADEDALLANSIVSGDLRLPGIRPNQLPVLQPLRSSGATTSSRAGMQLSSSTQMSSRVSVP